jgi:RNA polymerase sigma factor (sigma-70 family)
VTEAAPNARDADDAKLLNMVRAGDTTAFGILYERHEQAARRLARSLVGSPAEVDDAVAETFARVLAVTKRGGGPTDAFRPYVLTALRRVCIDQIRSRRAQVPTDDQHLPDPGQPFIDPAVAGLESSLIVRAFLSLPERWRAVLWHTEIEGASPADVAPLLGLTRNGVAALKSRAREGLRQAYLQMHVATVARPECKPVAERLGAFVRDALSRRENGVVAEHLTGCADCSAVRAELADVNVGLRGVVAPIFLGGAAASYLSGAGHDVAAAAAGTPGHAAGAATGKSGWLSLAGRLRRVPRQQRWLAGGLAVVVAAMLVGAWQFTLTGNRSPLAPARHQRPAVAGAVPSPASAHPRPRPERSRPGSALLPLSAAGPARSPRASGQPDPTSPATTTPSAPTPPASSGPTPTPSPSPTPAAQLASSVDVYGPGPGNSAQVVFEVTDTGTAGSGALTASITLPPGSSVIWGGGHGGHGGHGGYDHWGGRHGWTCQPDSTGASCQHDPISGGQRAFGVIFIGVQGPQACGQPVQLAAASGIGSTSAQSPEDVQCQSGSQGGYGPGLLAPLAGALNLADVLTR